VPAPEIQLHGLVKSFHGPDGPIRAVRGIDIEIAAGETLALLGPNGAGKSTFINILAGLVNKTSGQVKLWGMDIDEQPRAARAAIGVVPQEIVTDVFFTPRESLEVQAGFYGVKKADGKTDEILASLGLADKADAYVRQLSGGMKRRLMVAKAMVHQPPVLILDEPTAGVDVELRRQLWERVKELNARGVTIVLTTHYLEEAQALCDTIAIVNRGEVVVCEPTRDLLRRIDTRSVVITPQAPLDGVPELAGFEGKLRPNGNLAITYRSEAASVEAVLAAVRAAGVQIKDLSTEEPDLEDVFLSLTYGDANAASPIAY